MASLTGQDINGYMIGPLIGGGGMGEVYQAMPPNGGHWVALKVINNQTDVPDVDIQQRFVREIRLMQSLSHKNIVPIYDYGIADPHIYFVMKLISGPRLRVLMEKQHFTPIMVWNIIKPIAEALAYTHQQNIIHRDLKPGNIFLERAGDDFHVYLGDFGLGKNLVEDNNITAPGSSVGTYDYMPAEAIKGIPLDHRADIYSLTAVSYELLLGQLPLDPTAGGNNLARSLAPRRFPTSLHNQFPLALEDTLMKGLALEAADRYQSVNEFAYDFYDSLRKLSETELHTSYWVS